MTEQLDLHTNGLLHQMPKAVITFLRYHLPFLAYAALILMVSSVPNLHSPELRFIAFDKVAHLVEYGLFTLLAIRSLRNLMGTNRPGSAYGATLAILIVFALLDEWIQSFVPGRFADTADYLTDLLAGISVVAIHWLIMKRIQSVSN